jgi:hypothetical protein
LGFYRFDPSYRAGTVCPIKLLLPFVLGPLRELEALFEKLDFNSFHVVEEGKMLGMPQEPQRAEWRA